MKQKYIVLLFIFINVTRSDAGIFNDKIMMINRFEGQCSGKENMAMTFQNLSFIHKGKNLVISGKLVVRHDLNHQIEGHLILIRCSSKENLDSCENFNTLKFTKCCDLLNVKGQVWTKYVDSIRPEIKCPVKAGIYSLDNGTFDANLLFLPLEGWYWRIKSQSYDVVTREPLLCMNVEVEIKLLKTMN